MNAPENDSHPVNETRISTADQIARRSFLAATAGAVAAAATSAASSLTARDYGDDQQPVRYPEPDVVVLDVMMDHLSEGFQVARRIKDDPRNAIRYSLPENEVSVSVRPSAERVSITVQDHGIGIPEPLKGEVFLEFVRGPKAKQMVAHGTALGLTIASAAVANHGGEIDLASQEGVGTKITVSLPLKNGPPPRGSGTFLV